MKLELTGIEQPLAAPLVITVSLSRRNLLALLHKLDWPESARTVTSRYVYVDGTLVEPVEAALVIVRAEDDEAHYANREPPGPMNPVTEAFIAAAEESPRFLAQLLARRRESENEGQTSSESGGEAEGPTDEPTKGAHQ